MGELLKIIFRNRKNRRFMSWMAIRAKSLENVLSDGESVGEDSRNSSGVEACLFSEIVHVMVRNCDERYLRELLSWALSVERVADAESRCSGGGSLFQNK